METQLQHRKHRIVLQAVSFGLIFGFLLQKGGVAKYRVLEGQLLLTDFTVMKVMLSAILVAMLGLHLMRRYKRVEFHIKPTKIASNIVGGLIFGAGFALAGYCPGTGAAGLGQGDLPALLAMAGLVIGSYLYAESSAVIKSTNDTWGDRGKLTLHTALRMNVLPSVILVATIVLGALGFLKFADL